MKTCGHRCCYVPVLVVDLVAVPRRVDDVQPQLDAVLDNHYAGFTAMISSVLTTKTDHVKPPESPLFA